MKLLAILQEQRANRFSGVAGAKAAITLPISDRLLSRLIAERLPPDGAVRDLELRAHASNRIVVRVRLTRPAFLPAIAVTLVVIRQPVLPESPVVVFRVEMPGGLLGLAGPALRMMNALPPGIHLDGDRLEVDLRLLLDRYGSVDVLEYLQDLQVTTDEGRFVVTMQAAVPAPAAGSA
jgi:hypothetical protein